ncbi:hypothetical protein AAES_120023 [Amazona aestiva]|uniref:Matrix-remodeling-associated protein 7 n=1 Tax=Amazona aestiva TaxID=12930 RepID=A0A0Q3QXU6_AMAAE|nr:hypothetical protein AAES_120023 [Amazona aestiva]
MEVAVDLYLAVPLLFTVLAFILASIFMRLWGVKGEWPWEPQATKPAQESNSRDQEARMEQLLVEEVGAVKERKEGAAKQWEEAAEETSPAAESSPAVAKNIPQQPIAEPHEP